MSPSARQDGRLINVVELSCKDTLGWWQWGKGLWHWRWSEMEVGFRAIPQREWGPSASLESGTVTLIGQTPVNKMGHWSWQHSRLLRLLKYNLFNIVEDGWRRNSLRWWEEKSLRGRGFSRSHWLHLFNYAQWERVNLEFFPAFSKTLARLANWKNEDNIFLKLFLYYFLIFIVETITISPMQTSFGWQHSLCSRSIHHLLKMSITTAFGPTVINQAGGDFTH